MNKCSVVGCSRTAKARGWCVTHWARWRKHGDPMRVKVHSEYTKMGTQNHAYRHGCEQHPLYQTWNNMMKRCYSKHLADYKRYGARGITVCKEWHDVRRFIADMSPKPPYHTLERKNNSIGYSKENCEWAHRTTQARNRRTTKLDTIKVSRIKALRAKGVTRTKIASMFGVHLSTVKKVLAGTTWV